tara:strand:- start:491 stop:640 length:150 start_codon:yes stop_codon:yes gene_type:complete
LLSPVVLGYISYTIKRLRLFKKKGALLVTKGKAPENLYYPQPQGKNWGD